MNHIKEIEELEKMITSINSRYDKFLCLNTKEEYFNKCGLCGVVLEGEKYIWCNQYFPEGGDRPHNYFITETFDNIDELIQYVKSNIKRDLSWKYNTDDFKVQYVYNHKEYGYGLVCSKLIDGVWKDGYYIDKGSSLQYQCDC